jgi:prepilin-type processing-associated H-X9-DG protein
MQQLVRQPPSKIFVFIDEHPSSIGDGIFGLPVPWVAGNEGPDPHPWWGASMPADRHSQGCNLSFADGRAEHYRWRSPKKGMPEGDVQAPANPEDLQDLRRLQECAPKHIKQ